MKAFEDVLMARNSAEPDTVGNHRTAGFRFNGLNPETYLRDILTKIADGHTINRIDELVPWRMIPATAGSPP